MRVRRLGMFERVCVASNKYLAKHGTPHTPEDLKKHDCLIYTLLTTGATWRFQDINVPVSGRLRVNSPQAVQKFVNAGIGIAQGPEWLFKEGLENGNLQLLLTDYTASPVPIQAVYVASRLLPKRAIVFMDFVAEIFEKNPDFKVQNSMK
ncbi:LysR family transcriptional regulator [Raoultella planticola]|uniref:LysR family transcriptional regulator n=2 Tax=Raoultella planticola TaxID=575 RepID=A0A8G2A5V7_RAOPL|nr:LysR family transcriptional regulator [Raoultella planticola]